MKITISGPTTVVLDGKKYLVQGDIIITRHPDGSTSTKRTKEFNQSVRALVRGLLPPIDEERSLQE